MCILKYDRPVYNDLPSPIFPELYDPNNVST